MSEMFLQYLAAMQREQQTERRVDDGARSRTVAAALLGVSVDTLDRMRERGDIRAIVVGRSVRIPQSEIDRVLAEGTGHRGGGK